MNQGASQPRPPDRPAPRRLWADPRLAGLITALLIACCVTLALYRLNPPAAVGADGGAGDEGIRWHADLN